MRLDDLVGTWELESFSAKGADGTDSLPLGDAPRGLLSYAAGGYMAAVLMRSDRPKFASGDSLDSTAAEVRQAFEGFDAYAGPFEFDEATGVVTHYPQVSRFPNWEGTAQVRHVSLVDGKLNLVTPSILAAGQTWIATLLWRKVNAR